jgi:hypothetical protein
MANPGVDRGRTDKELAIPGPQKAAMHEMVGYRKAATARNRAPSDLSPSSIGGVGEQASIPCQGIEMSFA